MSVWGEPALVLIELRIRKWSRNSSRCRVTRKRQGPQIGLCPGILLRVQEEATVTRPVIRDFCFVRGTEQHLLFPRAIGSFLIDTGPSGPRCSKGNATAVGRPDWRRIWGGVKGKAGTDAASQVQLPDTLL